MVFDFDVSRSEFWYGLTFSKENASEVARRMTAMLHAQVMMPPLILAELCIVFYCASSPAVLSNASWFLCAVLASLAFSLRVEHLDIVTDATFMLAACTALCCASLPGLASNGACNVEYTVRPSMVCASVCPVVVHRFWRGLCLATLATVFSISRMACTEISYGDMAKCVIGALHVLGCWACRRYCGRKVVQAIEQHEQVNAAPVNPAIGRPMSSSRQASGNALRVLSPDGTVLLTLAEDEVSTMFMSGLFQRLWRMPACRLPHKLKVCCGCDVWHLERLEFDDIKVIDCLRDARVVEPWTMFCTLAQGDREDGSWSARATAPSSPRSEADECCL